MGLVESSLYIKGPSHGAVRLIKDEEKPFALFVFWKT